MNPPNLTSNNNSRMNVRKSEKNHQTKECEVRNDRRLFATEIEDPQKKPSTNCKTKNVTRDRASFQNNFMCYVGTQETTA